MYRVTEQTDAYEVGTDGAEITAACRCGAGVIVPDKGLGRATVAAWKTQHQGC